MKCRVKKHSKTGEHERLHANLPLKWKRNYYTSLLSQITLTDSMSGKKRYLNNESCWIKFDYTIDSPVGGWNCLYCFCCVCDKSISNFFSITACCSGLAGISSCGIKWGGTVGGNPKPAGGRASSSSSSSSSGSVKGSPFSSHSSTTREGKFPTFPSNSPSHLKCFKTHYSNVL